MVTSPKLIAPFQMARMSITLRAACPPVHLRHDDGVLPTGLAPMLATAGALPRGDGWAYELKWDGFRALAFVEAGTLTLRSRSGRDVTADYPGISLDVPDAVVDGELVALVAGAPDFSALQQRSAAITFVPFDLLHLQDTPLLDRTYDDRRALLAQLLPGVPPCFDDGPALLATTQAQGLEGVVAKRRGSTYQPGRRSADWVKTKHVRRQSAVVGGWRAAEGGRAGQVGALLLGVPAPEGLVYVGKVGTGFTERTLAVLAELLAPLARPTPPFLEPPREDAHWVEPVLVVDVDFTAWTRDGRLRHPTYRGVRIDLHASEVVRE
jgi:bifunctional non-homologous end joining protein LigD